MSVYDKELRLRTTVQGTKQAEAQLEGLNTSIGKIAGAAGLAVGALALFKGAMKFASESLEAYERALQAMREVNTTIVSTGREAEFTAQELSELANKLQAVSNFGDEDILQESTLSLLRFGAIGKDIFTEVQTLAVDMGAGMGSLSGASQTLGIAMSDPVAAITRLRRAGVVLGEEQQELIKHLVEVGDAAGAQRILLDELQEKYGGIAQASATSSIQMRNSWGDLQEAIGSHLGWFSGAKDGIAQIFSSISDTISTTAEDDMNAMYDTQNKVGTAIIKVYTNVGQFVDKMGIMIGGAVAVVDESFKVAGKSIKYAVNWVIEQIAGLAKKILTPFEKIASGINTIFSKLTGKDLGLDNVFDSIDEGFEKLTENTKKSKQELDSAAASFKSVTDGIKDDLAESENYWMGEKINRINALDEQTAARKSAYEKEKKYGQDLINLNTEEAESDAERLKAAADAHKKEVELWSRYYDTVNKYSDEWLEKKMELYELNTRAAYAGVLDEIQIQELLKLERERLNEEIVKDNKESLDKEARDIKEQADKLKATLALNRDLELEFVNDRERYLEIKKEQLEEEYQAHLEAGANIIVLEQWKAEKMKEIIDGMPEHYKNVFERMDMYMLESAQRMKDGALSILSNAIYDIFDSTEEGIEIWRQAWNSLWEILKRTVSMMIAELAALFVWQVITGTAPMGGFGAGKMKGTPVNTIVPDPIGHGNFASIGNRPQIGHIGASSGNVDTSTMKRHTQSLDRLSQAIEANGGIKVQLQIDGRDVRSSIKRVEHDLNVLGSLV